jgi:hypothetical protein
MDVQHEILDNFKQLSGVRSDQQATEILRRYNWDIDVNITFIIMISLLYCLD